MKILVLAPHPFFQNRGTPIALKMLLESLVAEGHDLTAMVYPEGEKITIPGCRILRVKKLPMIHNIQPGFSWKKIACDIVMLQMAGRLLKKEKFDLIHAGEEAVFLARHFNKRFKIPYVYDMDSSLPQQLCEKMPLLSPLLPLLTRFEKRVVQNSAGVLAVCKHLADLARSHDATTIVQQLEDVTLLPREFPEEKRKTTDLRLDKNTTHLMYVGNLERYQGIDLLLEAFSLAYLEKEKIKLVIIGGSKADITFYKRKTRNIGIADGVIFTGPKPVEDLACYLAQADILVSPRIKGYNTPMKIYSYMDSGRPILATCLETHTQVLDESVACLVEPVDADMAAGIMRLTRNTELRKTLADNARKRVQEEYNREAFNLKLQSFYTKIEHKLSLK
jgi:glycosyltransferase involved in cell wall biosynthesis